MAKDKNKSINEERTYVIPLRREFLKKAKYNRTKRAITTIQNFIIKHMKVKEVKLGKNLNEKVWERGRRNPPSKIKVKTIKEDNYARVELPEFPFEKKKEPEKKEGLKEKLLGKKEAKTDQQKEQELLKEGKVDIKEKNKVSAIEEKTTTIEEDTLIKTSKRMVKSQTPHHEKKK